MTSSLFLDYAGHSIAVELPDDASSVAEFLVAYLAPYFSCSPNAGRPSLAHVQLHLGSPPDAPSFAAGTPVTVDASGGFLRCDGVVVERGDRRWVELRPFGATVRIDRGANRIDLWAEQVDSLLVPALRVVEDLTLNEVQRHGGVVLHASAVMTEGRAVLAVGNKRAGKTSILCHTLHGFDVQKLANDNVCLWRGPAGGITARGWPSFFKVSLATAADFTELAADFPVSEREALWNDTALWQVYEKIALYAAQGAERFGATVVPEAPLGTIVFARFSAEASPGLVPVSIRDIVDDVSNFLQGVRNPNHNDWIGLNPVAYHDVEGALHRLLMENGQLLALYRLTWAPSLVDLLGRIPELRRSKKSLRACAAAADRPDSWPPLPTAKQFQEL